MDKLRLYKKTSTGAIQEWIIFTEDNEIVTTYGQVRGKYQTTVDTIDVGKNVGKVNETTAIEQAVLEAQAKYQKQLKKGYVRTIAEAEAGAVDAIIEGGAVPMLAKKYSEQGHKIIFPAYCQPKLDGIRCIATIADGVCTLWSRTRKPIRSVPHIVADLERLFPKGSFTFDGELYNHDYRNGFEQIVSLVRQDEPAEGHEVVQYHIYDEVSDQTFEYRTESIQNLFSQRRDPDSPIMLVRTVWVHDEDALMEQFDYFVSKGYEGAMVRNANSLYVNKRSDDLQKIKEFLDEEFKIVGIEEGRGRLQGHVAAFVCRMPDGQTFKAKMKGDTEMLRWYFLDHSLWTGKFLTVKYQGLTGRNGVPRFPVGLRFREDL